MPTRLSRLALALIAVGGVVVGWAALRDRIAFSPGAPPPIAVDIVQRGWPDCPPLPPRLTSIIPVPLALEAAVYRDALTGADILQGTEWSGSRARILPLTMHQKPPVGREPDFWGFVCYQFPELDLSALRNFQNENANEWPLRAWFMLPVRYEVVSSVPTSPPRSSPTIISLSRVGFSDDRTQALVYIERRHSEGAYVLLRKSGSSWRVVRKVTAWIS